MRRRRRNSSPTTPTPPKTPAERFSEAVEGACHWAHRHLLREDIDLAEQEMGRIPPPHKIRVPALRGRVQAVLDRIEAIQQQRRDTAKTNAALYEQRMGEQRRHAWSRIAEYQASWEAAQGSGDWSAALVALRDAHWASAIVDDDGVKATLAQAWEQAVRAILPDLPTDCTVGYSREVGAHLAVMDSAAGVMDAGVLVGLLGQGAAWICVDGDGSTPERADHMVARAMAAAMAAGCESMASVPCSVATTRALRLAIGD